MLRTHWMTSARAAVNYLALSDYYATSPGDLLGKGFEHLEIGNMSPRDVMEYLAHNLDPATGKLLRPHAREGGRIGMDFTFNAPKSVTLARELGGEENAGDPEVEAAHREAVAYAMRQIEADMKTRVRVGKADEDRVTGNLFAYRVTHRDTRINAEDQRPDPHLHDHVFVMNLTYDPFEEKYKAAQVADIKHDANYYEAIYMNRLAHNLKGLDYGIRRDKKAFEVQGIDRPLIEKFSRRTKYIEKVTEKLGIKNPESKAKLGATTRLGKTDELVEDLNGYFVSRLTEEEKGKLQHLKGLPSYESTDEKAVQYTIDHEFYRQSVVEEKKLYETALRHGIGSVTPEGIQEEAKLQGVLLKDKQATHKFVLEEESRIIDFAREGKGTMRPLANQIPSPQQSGNRTHANGGYDHIATPTALAQEKSRTDGSMRPHSAEARPDVSGPVSRHPARLSPEQQAVCRHVWESTDQLMMIRGAAGTGKTTTSKAVLEAIDVPYAVLAPTAEASRGVLRSEGFKDANTVSAFLQDRTWQERTKGGVLWVDEAALLPIRDLSQLTEIAREQNARIVMMGDPAQHKSVLRHGNMFNVLQEFAGIKPAELRTIRRQDNTRHREAVSAIESGNILKGHEIMRELDWIKEVETKDVEKATADACWDYVRKGETPGVIGITHAQNEAITTELRSRLRAEGKLGKEDHMTPVLVPQHWSDPQKKDPFQYEGNELAQFFRSIGPFKAGQRVQAAELLPHLAECDPEHFAVYRAEQTPLAKGDVIRMTANGWSLPDKQGKTHRINNGSKYEVKGIAADGKITLKNGWVMKKDVAHFRHGYIDTSMAAQGKTEKAEIGVMTQQNLPGINAEQYYVTLSRPRGKATIITDLPDETLREVIQKRDKRTSATELMKKKPKRLDRLRAFLTKARDRLKSLQATVTKERQLQKELEYGLQR